MYNFTNWFKFSHGETTIPIGFKFDGHWEWWSNLRGGANSLISPTCSWPWKILRHDGFEGIVSLPRGAHPFLAPFGRTTNQKHMLIIIYWIWHGHQHDIFLLTHSFMFQCHWIVESNYREARSHSYHNTSPSPASTVFLPLFT